MPEEIPNPEVKAEAPVINEDKLAASIAKGVAESIKAARAQDAPTQAPVTAAISPAAPAPLPQMVSDDEIDAAIEAGDKAKVRELRQRQRLAQDAHRRRELETTLAPGLAAINQLSESEVKADPYFKKYEKEVRQLISEVPNGQIVTAQMWREALNMVKGRHADEIAEEKYEERVRQQREAAAAPAPAGRAPLAAPEEKELETLTEAFGAGFKARFAEKQRTVGGRSEDAEVAEFDKWFRAKMPQDHVNVDDKGRPTKFKRIETVKDYIKEAREIEAIAAEDPSLGLGS